MTTAGRQIAQVLLQSVVLMSFWVASVASLKPHEILVGILATLLATALSTFILRTLAISFCPSLRDLTQVWRLIWYAFSGTVEIILVLLRDLAGRPAPSLFRSAPYFAVTSTGRDIAKRVLAIAYTTVAPNFVVVGIDRKRGQLLFHQVEASKVPRMTQKLGAGSGGEQ